MVWPGAVASSVQLIIGGSAVANNLAGTKHAHCPNFRIGIRNIDSSSARRTLDKLFSRVDLKYSMFRATGGTRMKVNGRVTDTFGMSDHKNGNGAWS
jgi:hypothetical protein